MREKGTHHNHNNRGGNNNNNNKNQINNIISVLKDQTETAERLHQIQQQNVCSSLCACKISACAKQQLNL